MPGTFDGMPQKKVRTTRVQHNGFATLQKSCAAAADFGTTCIFSDTHKIYAPDTIQIFLPFQESVSQGNKIKIRWNKDHCMILFVSFNEW
jgi:hypothetical protein